MKLKLLIKKSIQLFKNYGFKFILKKICKSTKYKINICFNKNSFKYKRAYSKYYKQIDDILNFEQCHSIIIFDSRVGWNIPLFQRPQHMANELSKKGFLYFYRSSEQFDLGIDGIKKIKDRLYLVNMSNYVLQNVLIDIVSKINKEKFLLLYSTDIYLDEEYIRKRYLNNGFKIIYEYIDEISAEISGDIPNFVYKRHKNIIKNEQNFIIVTADKLMNDVKGIRNMYRVAMITNGVDYNHWKKKDDVIPEKIKDITKKGKPIIGYFGALAKWFDYNLIKEIAIKKPNYDIVLIGFLYDDGFRKSGIENIRNIHYLGVVDYNDLPLYGKQFDVAVIPFLLNDITESTNPVKLFEYMALNIPIVTTNLRECKKYKSTLIGENYNEFIEKLEYALKINENDKYYTYLKDEALENTWEKKAEIFYKLIKNKI